MRTKSISLSILILLSLVTSGFNSTEKTQSDCPVTLQETSIQAIEVDLDDAEYPIVATTKNGFLENYSIHATVSATKIMNFYSIQQVTVNGSTVGFHSVPLSDDEYYFFYDGQSYYFTF